MPPRARFVVGVGLRALRLATDGAGPTARCSGGLVRLTLDGTRVTREERHREGELDTRIRDVVQGPDGAVWLVTDEDDGKVLRLAP